MRHIWCIHANFPFSLGIALQNVEWSRISQKTHGCAEITHFGTRVHHRGLGSTRPQPECFPVSDDAPSWEMCNFHGGMALAFIPWPGINTKAAMQKLCISAHPFSAWIVSWSQGKTWNPWKLGLEWIEINLSNLVWPTCLTHCHHIGSITR